MKVLRAGQLRAFTRDVLLLLSSSATAELGPLIGVDGVVHLTGAQWLGVADRVGAAVLLGVLALVGTPLTRRYGVGAPIAAATAPIAAVPPSA